MSEKRIKDRLIKIMKRIYSILFFLLSALVAYSQGEAGIDKVICKGGSVEIGSQDKGYCYVWDAAQGLTDRNKPNPVVSPTTTTTYRLTVVGQDFSFKRPDEVTVYVAEVKLVNPTTNQKVKFDASATGKLEVEFKASVTPDNQTIRDHFAGKIKFDIDAIGASTLTWNNAGGIAIYASGFFGVKATFNGLPNSNSDFGEKNIKMEVQDCNAMNISDKIKIFYDAVATNHPGGVATDPNWFYYYKDNGGGGSYKYDNTGDGGRSYSTSGGGDATVRISDEAYAGDNYIITAIISSQLTATGVSAVSKYYANFIGVLSHERQHANNQINTGPPADRDSDRLSNTFETSSSKTDPDNAFSAQGILSAGLFPDREVYAGGPIEEAGIKGANTSSDWAYPGTNWP